MREVLEETGYHCHLGRFVGEVEYLDRRERREDRLLLADAASRGQLSRPTPEVDELRWLPLAEAVALLSYSHDRELLEFDPDAIDQGERVAPRRPTREGFVTPFPQAKTWSRPTPAPARTSQVAFRRHRTSRPRLKGPSRTVSQSTRLVRASCTVTPAMRAMAATLTPSRAGGAPGRAPRAAQQRHEGGDEEERRQEDGQGREQGRRQPTDHVTDRGRRREHRSRGHLADRHRREQLRLRQPVVVEHEVAAEIGDEHVARPEDDRAELQELQEQRRQRGPHEARRACRQVWARRTFVMNTRSGRF